jgi:hypothetical protein
MSKSPQSAFAAALQEILERRLGTKRSDDDLHRSAAGLLGTSKEFVRSTLSDERVPSLKYMRDMLDRLFRDDKFADERKVLLAKYLLHLGLEGADEVVVPPAGPRKRDDEYAGKIVDLLGYPDLGVATPPQRASQITEILARALRQDGEEMLPLQILSLYAQGRALFCASVDRDQHRPYGDDPSEAFYAAMHRGADFSATLQATTTRFPTTMAAAHRHDECQLDLLVCGCAWIWAASPEHDFDRLKLIDTMDAGEVCVVPARWLHAFVGQDAIKLSITFSDRKLFDVFDAQWHRETRPRVLRRAERPSPAPSRDPESPLAPEAALDAPADEGARPRRARSHRRASSAAKRSADVRRSRRR